MLIKHRFIAIAASVVVGIVIVIGVQQYATKVIVSLEKSQIVAEKAKVSLLTLRRHEKDFLARNDLAYKEKFDKEHDNLIYDINEIGKTFQEFGGNPEQIESLVSSANTYKEQFANIVELHKQIGLDVNSGWRGEARNAATTIENNLSESNVYQPLWLLAKVRFLENEFLLNPSAANTTTYSNAVTEFSQSLQNSRMSADKKTDLQTMFESYNENILRVIDAYTKKGFKSDQGLIGNMRGNIHNIEKSIKEVEDYFGGALDARLSRITWILFTMTLAAAGFVIVMLYFMSKRIISSVTTLSVAMKESSSNKDLSVRVSATGKDELAQIGDAFNRMTSEFESIIHQITHTSSSLSQSAHQLSSITEKTNDGVLRQHRESDQAATAMNEMAATVQEVAKHAANAAHASDTANGEAIKGKNIVAETTTGIQQLSSEVQNTANAISQLEKESANIGTVLNVIQGIAEQTNLLALNAAIEAARAGESGRGFAVVADEVRSLAQRSQSSTQEIKTIIERLQSVARDAVVAMESGLKQTQTTVTQAQSAGQSLEAITEAVMRINEMNTQIATAAEEQSSVAEEINKNVNNIAHISDETAGLAQETLNTSSRLANFVSELQQLVGRFKLSHGTQSLDLSKAKAAHLAWKARLRSFLDGNSVLTIQEAVSHQHCVLGKWYYSEGMAKFGHIQEMKDVEPPHTEMHALIKQIVEQKQAGNTREAEALYKRVGPLSERIVALLETVERKVSEEMQKLAS